MDSSIRLMFTHFPGLLTPEEDKRKEEEALKEITAPDGHQVLLNKKHRDPEMLLEATKRKKKSENLGPRGLDLKASKEHLLVNL